MDCNFAQVGLQAQFPAVKGYFQARKPERQRKATADTTFGVTWLQNHTDGAGSDRSSGS
jgi:hypothetical protein